jgi:hypothetical protein
MTTTAKTTAADTIVAIDLGKYKSVACVPAEASGTFHFTSFETTRSELHRLLARGSVGDVQGKARGGAG